MEDWDDKASCKGVDPAIFFPEKEEGNDSTARVSKEICCDCPVQPQCLDFAVRNKEPAGIWGGVSTEGRRDLRRAFMTGNVIAYQQAFLEAHEHLGRTIAGHDDERPWQEERKCERCGARVPAGRWPKDKNGPNATCGHPSTFNKGCRCDWCRAKKSLYQKGN